VLILVMTMVVPQPAKQSRKNKYYAAVVCLS
jgi:hypothetical protein